MLGGKSSKNPKHKGAMVATNLNGRNAMVRNIKRREARLSLKSSCIDLPCSLSAVRAISISILCCLAFAAVLRHGAA